MTVLGDWEEGLSVVQTLERVEDGVFLDLAPLDPPLAPPGLPLSLD